MLQQILKEYKEYLASLENIPKIQERVQIILNLFHKYGLEFDDTKIIEKYFEYTEQFFEDLPEKSFITFEEQIQIINNLING